MQGRISANVGGSEPLTGGSRGSLHVRKKRLSDNGVVESEKWFGSCRPVAALSGSGERSWKDMRLRARWGQVRG